MTPEDKHRCERLGGMLGWEIRDMNAYKLACLGAPKEIVEKNEVDARLIEEIGINSFVKFPTEKEIQYLINMKHTNFWPWYFRNTWFALVFLIGVPTVHALIQDDPFWTHVVNMFFLAIICVTVIGSWAQWRKHLK